MPDFAQAPSLAASSANGAVIKVENVARCFIRPARPTSARLPTSNWTSPRRVCHGGRPQRLRQIDFAQTDRRILPVFGRSDSFSRRRSARSQYQVGYVPQESKLFPWLTVEENVGFGLSPSAYSQSGPRAADDYLSSSPGSRASKNIIPRNSPAAWANGLRSSARSLTNRRLY